MLIYHACYMFIKNKFCNNQFFDSSKLKYVTCWFFLILWEIYSQFFNENCLNFFPVKVTSRFCSVYAFKYNKYKKSNTYQKL